MVKNENGVDVSRGDMIGLSRRIVSWSLAGATLCLCALAGLMLLRTEHRSSLLSLPNMGKAEKDIAALDQEIQMDLSANHALSQKYAKTMKGKSGCHCDCSQSAPEFRVKAAAMLEQVGEVCRWSGREDTEGGYVILVGWWQDAFFGPCSSCPCMKSSSIETEVPERERRRSERGGTGDVLGSDHGSLERRGSGGSV